APAPGEDLPQLVEEAGSGHRGQDGRGRSGGVLLDALGKLGRRPVLRGQALGLGHLLDAAGVHAEARVAPAQLLGDARARLRRDLGAVEPLGFLMGEDPAGPGHAVARRGKAGARAGVRRMIDAGDLVVRVALLLLSPGLLLLGALLALLLALVPP